METAHIEIDYNILIDFFNKKIKLSRENFEYKYPINVDNNVIRKNQNLIRKNLISDYLRVNFKADVEEQSMQIKIAAMASRLSKSTCKRSIQLLVPPSRKRRKLVRDDDEYIPSGDSDEDDVCSSSQCKKVQNEYTKQIEELQETVRLQQAEIEKLRAVKQAQELQTYNDLYPKLCLFSQNIGCSVRMTQKFMGFLKDNVKSLGKIVVPSHTFIHQQSYLIDTISSKQKERFIESAEYLTMAVDGTPFRNGKCFAVVLFNQDHQHILFGMDYYIKGDAHSLTVVTEKILGHAKNLIYSKITWVLSDTDQAQKKSLREIIQNIMKVDRIVKGEPNWGACNLHNAGRSETYGKEQLSEKTQTFLKIISKIAGPTSNKYSANNINQNLILSRKEENLPAIKIIPEKGSRFYFLTHNGREFFQNADWFEEFFEKTLQTHRHRNNDQLETLTELLKQNKNEILLEIGIFCSFWIYLIRPVYSYFSKPVDGEEAMKVLNNLLTHCKNSDKIKQPIPHLTKSVEIFDDISSFDAPPSDISVDFTKDFIKILTSRKINGHNITKKQFSSLENMTRKFLGKIHDKYQKEYGGFINNKFEKGLKIFLSNQHVESVFGHFKNKKCDSNTTVHQLMSRTELVFNKSLSWVMKQDDVDEIFEEAAKSKKINRDKGNRKSLDHDKNMLEFLNESA